MAYAAWSVTAGEQPTAAKWNILGTNDASFNDGTGIASGTLASVKLTEFDWYKYVPGTSYSSVVAGSWTRLGANVSTGTQGWDAAQSGGSINEEIQYKCVLAAGTYSVFIHCDKDVNRGILTTSVDGSSIGTTDMYNASRVANAVLTISTTLVIASNKIITLNLKMATKNASSGGYYITNNAVEFVRTA